MFRLFFVICILTLSLSSNAVIDNQTSNADPYFSTNYTKAFDIAILKKFSNVLEVEGAFCFADLPSYTSCFCGFDSLFSNFRRIASCSIAPKDAQPLSPLLNYETYLNRKNEMNDALLAQLYKEKKAAIWRPAGAATLGIASMVPVSVVGFGVTTLLPPAQQALALWPLMETINKAGDLLQVSATAAFNSLIPPNDPLLALEIEFTKRLPYATEDERKIISNILMKLLIILK